MASTTRSTFETRYEQMFPTLDPAEIARLRRFGEPRAFRAGERLVTTGEVSPGMFVIVSGEVALSQHSVLGGDQPILVYGPGSFTGELAQLSGQPSLVDARAIRPVDAFVVPSRRLRDVLVAEAELGERIMRALILRRVGLLESGVAGPVIVGRAASADVLRLAGFLSRSGHPHHELDPETDPSARTLVESFHVAAEDLPVVLCPGGALLRNPSEAELASCLGLVRALDPAQVHDVAIVGAGPAGLAAASTARRRASPSSSSTPARSEARRARRRASRTTSASRPGSLGSRSWRAPTTRRRSSAPTCRSRTRWSGWIEAVTGHASSSAWRTESGSAPARW
jgi:thioredoxin reductase (NADPH)